MNLKILSYNVQHFHEYRAAGVNYPLFAAVLRNINADIIGLNETYGPGSSFGAQAQAEILAQALGYHWYFAPASMIEEEGIFGNSILSRYPITGAESVPIPDPVPRGYDGYYETRCVLRCTVETPDTPLQIAVTHFGLNPDEQENAAATVCGLIAPERFLLMGDFNVRPDAPVLTPLRAQLQDTAALLPADAYSFPADKPDRRIDYLFTSRDLAVQSAAILPIEAADHRPYLAEIRT